MTSFFEPENAQCDVAPLILCTADGHYSVDESTLAWIESHRGNFAVVACAGKYRTGKSFLLNRLAEARSGSGFGVGETVQACTKGLWVYKKFFATDDPTKHILLVDTEGIDALDADDTHDVRIFTLALLLSSVFLYNSVGAIDETAMQTLSLMTRVTNNVRVQNDVESSAAELSEHMPTFYWVLRDFALKLTDRKGNPITTDEYLEEALQATDPQRDHIRSAIRNAFPRRKLVTLPRPDQHLNNLEDRLFNIAPKFTQGIADIRHRIFRDARPLETQGKVLSAKMYSALCRHMTEVVQTNAVPVIRDSWSLMAAVQARDVRDDLIAQFCTTTDAMSKQPAHILDEKLDTLRADLMKAFDERAMPPIDAETRRVLGERLLTLAEQARVRLAKDLTEDVTAVMDSLENLIPRDVAGACTRLHDEQTRFFDEFGKDADTVRTWSIVVSERLLSWIAKIELAYTSNVEQLTLKLNTESERCHSMQREIETMKEVGAQEFRVRLSESSQLLEVREKELQAVREEAQRLEREKTALEAQLRSNEIDIERLRATADVDPNETSDVDPDNSDGVVEKLHADLVDMQSRLQHEQHERATCDKQNAELTERLENISNIHKKLETSWNKGLEELRESERKLRLDHDDQVRQYNEEIERVKMQLKDARHNNQNLEERIQSMNSSIESNHEIYENEKQQLRDTAQKHREQCESAQQRVLEIHKSMLEDLRDRDERARSQQTTHLKECAELQGQCAQLTQENERSKQHVQSLQRRNSDLESMERDCKRLKTQHQSNNLIINRLEAENEQLKKMTTTMGEERERLRRENMGMEGELAVLRAEKQLSDAKKCAGVQ